MEVELKDAIKYNTRVVNNIVASQKLLSGKIFEGNLKFLLKTEGEKVSKRGHQLNKENCFCIDTVSNLVFWSCLANKLGPWHNVYII